MDHRRSTILNPWPATAEELAVIEPREAPSIVDWAPENLIIPAKESPNLSGRFSWQYSPHLRQLCDWFNDPAVRQITVMAGLQRGKSLFMMLCLAWLIANDPGPTMLVMPDENTLRRRMKRLRPLFGANPFMLDKLGGKTENLFLGEPTDLGDMICVLGWAGSAATISDYPIRYEFLDEIVLWIHILQRVSLDPMQLLRGRQNTFPGTSKTVIVSSSGLVGDLLDTEFEEGDRCEYWVRCPKCDCPQIPYWHRSDQKGCYVDIDKDKSGDWLRVRDYELGKHARYVCPSCMKPWSDYDRAHALQGGVWLPDGVTMDRNGRIEGAIEPTAYKSARIRAVMVHPRISSLGRMAADWVRGQKKLSQGNREGLKYFLNNHEAISWQETQADTDADRALKHRGDYVSGVAPAGVQAITLAIDVQVDHLRYAVFGWGYLYECWAIEFGRLETGDTKELEHWVHAAQLIVRPWPLADAPDMVLPPSLTAIDCGYHTDVVLNFCRQQASARAVPAFGSARRMTRQYAATRLDEAVTRYEVDPLSHKDWVYRCLFVTEQAGGGYVHLPKDITPEIIGELCSEKKIRNPAGWPIWVPKTDGRANHAWDLAYLNRFAATVAGVGTLGPYRRPQPPKRKPKREGEDRPAGFLDGLPSLG